MSQARHIIFADINALELGTNAQTLDSAVTSNAIGSEGFNWCTVDIDYTYGAGTALEMYIETTKDLSGTPTWRRLQSGSVSSGTETLRDWKYSKVGTDGSTPADFNAAVNFSINYHAMRLVFSCTGSPTTSDIITATVRLAVV